MKDYQRVLLATDLTDDSHLIAKKAKAIAEQASAELHVLHAIEAMPVLAYGFVAIADIEAEIEQEASKRLSDLGKNLHIPNSRQYLKKEPSKLAITDVAEEIKPDLIIIGSHSKQGFFNTLGSTATAVVNDAYCDVLVIRLR